MNVCSKCGAETEYKKGVSKKTGNAWEGYKCMDTNCNNMDFINKPKQTHQLQQTPSNTGELVMLNSILTELKEIKGLLRENQL